MNNSKKKPMNQDGLEEEIDRFEDWMETYNQADYPTSFTTRDIARHFAQWGAEHAKKDEIPVPADLEEAANEYTYRGMPDEMKLYVKPVGDEVIKNFIAGAEWQKEQDNAISRQAEAERIKTQQMCYEKGQADMKRLMMQEAVEGEVIKDNRGNNVIRADVFNKDFEYGDKVRVIVIPNTDEK